MSDAAANDKTIELEIKYLLPDFASLKKAWDAFLLHAGEILRERKYFTVFHYFDTAEADLFEARTTLRKMDAALPHFKAHMDVKTLGEIDASGALVRKEFPYPMDVDAFSLDVITDAEAQELLKPIAGKPLREYFSNTSDRQDICAVFNSKARRAAIEISVEKTDYYDADTGDLMRTTYELEVEFKHKFSDAAISRADALALIVETGNAITAGISGVEVNTLSKAEIGFDLKKQRKSFNINS